MMYTVWQPLVTPNYTALYGQGTIQYLPALAANWTVSPDGTTYTFNLRQGVTYSNGDPFNAYEVWAWLYSEYYLNGNSSGWFESYPLFNMSSVQFGPSTLAMLSASGLNDPSAAALKVMSNSSWPIYVTGQYQIVFRLHTDFQWFLGTLVAFEGLLPDVQYMFAHGGLGTPTSYNSYFNTNIVPGTGPYMANGGVVNSYVSFTQSPTYWGRNLTASQIAGDVYMDPGHVKNVIVQYKSSDLSRYTDLSTGAAQISAIQSEDWPLVLANPTQYGYVTLPSFAGLIFAFALNTQLYPTNITDVRQAIVHAINYTNIIDTVFFGQATPFVGPEYPAWSQYYDLGNEPSYSYNLTLAEQYLAQANIKGPLSLTYRIAEGCPDCASIAQIVQSDLAPLNMTVNIDLVTSAQIYTPTGGYSAEVQNAAEFGNIGVMGGVSAYAPGALTPADNWLLWTSNTSASNNWAIYSNPVVQKCDDSFTNGDNTSEIQTLCTAAQAQIYQDAPYGWVGTLKLWWNSGSIVYNKAIINPNFALDPVWSGGAQSVPMFNTVSFVSS
jgi:ABC-type transport system substrate-binding protein